MKLFYDFNLYDLSLPPWTCLLHLLVFMMLFEHECFETFAEQPDLSFTPLILH